MNLELITFSRFPFIFVFYDNIIILVFFLNTVKFLRMTEDFSTIKTCLWTKKKRPCLQFIGPLNEHFQTFLTIHLYLVIFGIRNNFRVEVT